MSDCNDMIKWFLFFILYSSFMHLYSLKQSKDKVQFYLWSDHCKVHVHVQHVKDCAKSIQKYKRWDFLKVCVVRKGRTTEKCKMQILFLQGPTFDSSTNRQLLHSVSNFL